MNLDEEIKKCGIYEADHVKECLEIAPPYFWTVPASLSGKHHPESSRGLHGLIVHTKAVCAVFDDLARTYGWPVNSASYTAGMVACILHDTCKYGIGEDPDHKYITVHPTLPQILYADIMHQFMNAKVIANAIYTHMGNIENGAWSPLRDTTPSTKIEQAVHLADFIASRKNIKVEFYK